MTTDIFIRSYNGDNEWLKYCLRSIQRFATGFRRTIVVVPHGHNPPTGDAETVFYVGEICDQYMQQQNDKLHADHFTDAEFILYQDSDTIFTRPITPEMVIRDSRRPVWLYTPYASLGNDESQLWKKITEKFIGHAVPFEFMRRHPFVVSATILRQFRAWCHRIHGVSIERYVMTQPDRKFSEFNALGAWLWFHRKESVQWLNTDDDMGTTFVHQSYSWGGLNDDIRANLERALA